MYYRLPNKMAFFFNFKIFLLICFFQLAELKIKVRPQKIYFQKLKFFKIKQNFDDLSKPYGQKNIFLIGTVGLKV